MAWLSPQPALSPPKAGRVGPRGFASPEPHASQKSPSSSFRVQVGTLDHSLTFRRGQIDAVLLTEVDREDGVGGSVIAEPVRAVVRCGSVNADHEISVQEDLRQEVRGINEELHLL